MDASLTSPSDIHPDRRDSDLTRVAALGTVVTVWAHPDDETYLTGGLMALASHAGNAVTCITATNGDFAADEHERRRIGAVRDAELDLALALLGVTDSVRLGFRDGGCHDVDEVAVALIAAVLASRRPDTVITFGPDGLTGHADHRAVSRWTAAAVRATCPHVRLLCPSMTHEMVAADRDINDRFDVYAPGLPTAHAQADLELDLVIAGPWLDLKLAALRAHESQTTGLIAAIGTDRYRRWVAREPMLAFDRYRV